MKPKGQVLSGPGRRVPQGSAGYHRAPLVEDERVFGPFGGGLGTGQGGGPDPIYFKLHGGGQELDRKAG